MLEYPACVLCLVAPDVCLVTWTFSYFYFTGDGQVYRVGIPGGQMKVGFSC
jgi:hypothetical protein